MENRGGHSHILRAIAVFTEAHYRDLVAREYKELHTCHVKHVCLPTYICSVERLNHLAKYTRGRTLHMQQYLDLLIDALLDEGFTVEEANQLIQLREEYEEQLATEETNYHRFIRWLVEHGRLSDWY